MLCAINSRLHPTSQYTVASLTSAPGFSPFCILLQPPCLHFLQELQCRRLRAFAPAFFYLESSLPRLLQSQLGNHLLNRAFTEHPILTFQGNTPTTIIQNFLPALFSPLVCITNEHVCKGTFPIICPQQNVNTKMVMIFICLGLYCQY